MKNYVLKKINRFIICILLMVEKILSSMEMSQRLKQE